MTGYVACDFTEGDQLEAIRHGEIYPDHEMAVAEAIAGSYDGVRWVGEDGFLYVDAT